MKPHEIETAIMFATTEAERSYWRAQLPGDTAWREQEELEARKRQAARTTEPGKHLPQPRKPT